MCGISFFVQYIKKHIYHYFSHIFIFKHICQGLSCFSRFYAEKKVIHVSLITRKAVFNFLIGFDFACFAQLQGSLVVFFCIP